MVLDYDTDTITVTGAAGMRTIAAQRTDLLTNLLQHRADPSVALLCPPPPPYRNSTESECP